MNVIQLLMSLVKYFINGYWKNIRLLKNDLIVHSPHPIKKTKKYKPGLKSCTVCSQKGNKRNIRTFCSVCKVPLCIKVPQDQGFQTSCWDVWHSEDDLAAECKK